MKITLLSLCLFVHFLSILAWGGDKEKVLLEKVSAITLEEGKMTNARRTSAISQLDCVGGSAGCYGYRPKIVQCRNVGFDGYDVQWECKTDMDNKFRFGRIEVSCEGYSEPNDPYVLRGSCGLKYELDLTEEGQRDSRESGSYDQGHYSRGHHNDHYTSSSSGSLIGTLIQLAIIGLVIYCVLGACLGSRSGNNSSNNGGYSSSYTGSSMGSSGGGGSSSGPGFWSGAATGGALGYLFGSRGSGRRYGGYNRGWGGGSSWGSGGSSWGGGGSSWGGGGWSSGSRSSGSRSSGSRTTSGFGGTSRR